MQELHGVTPGRYVRHELSDSDFFANGQFIFVSSPRPASPYEWLVLRDTTLGLSPIMEFGLQIIGELLVSFLRNPGTTWEGGRIDVVLLGKWGRAVTRIFCIARGVELFGGNIKFGGLLE